MTSTETTQRAPLLDVADLSVRLPVGGAPTEAVAGVSFTVEPGQIMGLVGESGCGKSITAMAVMGLLPPGGTASGRVLLEGTDLLGLSPKERRAVAGRDLGLVFQEPMTALHPVLPIGEQLTEGLRRHHGLHRRQALARAGELLEQVGIPSSRGVLSGYVHQLSGGMRQRVMIAMTLACDPKLVIADEPTTALDVTIQAQILQLLAETAARTGTGLVLITHDLGVVAELCDRITVMYAGHVVEQGPTRQVLDHPDHPYTQGLLASRPRMGDRRDRLTVIPGQVPQLGAMPDGCRFAARCARADEQCGHLPGLEDGGAGRTRRCWHPIEDGAA